MSSHIALPQTTASRDQMHGGIHYTTATPGGGVTSHKASVSAIPGRTITSTPPAGSKTISFWTFYLYLIVPVFLHTWSIIVLPCHNINIFFLVSVMRNHSGQPVMDKQATGIANSSFRMKPVQQSRTQRSSSSRPMADRDPATAEYAPGRSTSAWHSHKWKLLKTSERIHCISHVPT